MYIALNMKYPFIDTTSTGNTSHSLPTAELNPNTKSSPKMETKQPESSTIELLEQKAQKKLLDDKLSNLNYVKSLIDNAYYDMISGKLSRFSI